MSTENKWSLSNMLSWRVVTILSVLFSIGSLMPERDPLDLRETYDATDYDYGEYLP